MGQVRRSIFAVNQVVGPLFRELLEDLSEAGLAVTCLSGWVDAPPGEPLAFENLGACPLVKTPAWRRLWSWSAFALQSLIALARRRGRLALLVTNPPLVPWLAPLMRRLFGLRYVVLVYDVYPEVMVRMGMIRRGGLTDRLLSRLARRGFRRAECVITIGEEMAEAVRRYLRPEDEVTVHVIDNWVDTRFIRPLPRKENPFARREKLLGKFVVTYSGAFGSTHGIDALVDAAALCRDLTDVEFVLIGGGTQYAQIERLVAERKLSNLRLMPFQPLATLPHTLAAADVVVVSLAGDYAGVSVPSKTYYGLAAGAAILAVCGEQTELARLVERHDCGLLCPPGSGEALAECVHRLAGDRAGTRAMGRRARAAAEQHYDRKRQTEAYRQCLEPLG